MYKKILLGLLCLVITAQGDPLVTIEDSITTAYGTYYPYPVDVTPSIPYYEIEPDFSNVVHYRDIFTEGQKELLLENGFVIIPTDYRELYDIYNSAYFESRPVFITTDFVLHTFHILVTHLMKGIEKYIITPRICDLTNGMLSNTRTRVLESPDPVCIEACQRNYAFFGVGAELLSIGGCSSEPSFRRAYYLQDNELGFIYSFSGFWFSPIFEYQLDYSQFKVRGNYAGNDTLEKYFRTMM